MSKIRPRVFLSYGKENSDEALMLYKQLMVYGADVWFDKESLLGGQRWKTEITSAIETSRYFLVLLSTKSVTRKGFINREITTALEILQEFPDNETFIVPARLDDCRPSHKLLNELQWINLYPDWNKGLFEILRAVGLSEISKKYSPFDISICPQCGASEFIIKKVVVGGWNLGYDLVCNRCKWSYDLGEPDPKTMQQLFEKFR